MLAEILKQPTGPEAARLALLIELSRYKGMDLAAKAVVSSYQQNNPASSAPTQPRPQNPQSPNSGNHQNAAAAAQPANAATAARLLPLPISPPALGGAAVKNIIAAQIGPPELRTSLPVPATDMPESAPAASKPEGKAEGAGRPLQSPPGNVTTETTAEARPARSPRAENGEIRRYCRIGIW